AAAQPKPRTARVPYTTLFRSEHPQRRRVEQTWMEGAHRHRVVRQRVSGANAGLAVASRVPREAGARPEVVRVGLVERAEPVGPADRKSTRLNSSHEWISYAVF